VSARSEAGSAFDRQPDADSSALEAALVAAFRRSPQRIERAAGGVSTTVYRVVVDGRTYYARLAEEEDDDLSVDAHVLRELAAAGVRAPGVVHLDPLEPNLRRSLLITSAIPGTPLGAVLTADAGAIAREAGRDLALIHQLPVHGFGFVRRDRATWPPVGEFASYEAFIQATLPDAWPGRFGAIFTPRSLESLLDLIEAERRRSFASATFAHGDFDLTHIFSLGGRYTGLIDFGEIRGAEPAFDFGVFLFVNAGTERASLLDPVIAGYQTVAALEEDQDAIARSAVMHGVRLLSRWTKPGFRLRRPVEDFARRVELLLDQL
jgi:aminoglycoside phosphotransferase (APT) family kinase protein